MELNILLDLKKEIQKSTICFIYNNQYNEEIYQNMTDFFQNNRLLANRTQMLTLLNIISTISNNHHRSSYFYNKIEQILLFFKDTIKKFFSKEEIFKIFQSNKRILLFLLREKLINAKQIATAVNNQECNHSYFYYFFPEIKILVDKELITSFSITDFNKFNLNREIGENDDYICQLIRNDLIEEFIIYVNKNDLPLSTKVKPSIFETHPFLTEKEPSLIEYSAFFGSTQIFRYLYLNQTNLNTKTFWIYAIHGNNPELIQFLYDNKIIPSDEIYQICLKEAIKCHHNEMAEYIINNRGKNDQKAIFSQSIRHFNFHFFTDDLEAYDDSAFVDLCRHGQSDFVDFLLRFKAIDINRKKVQIFYSTVMFFFLSIFE